MRCKYWPTFLTGFFGLKMMLHDRRVDFSWAHAAGPETQSRRANQKLVDALCILPGKKTYTTADYYYNSARVPMVPLMREFCKIRAELLVSLKKFIDYFGLATFHMIRGFAWSIRGITANSSSLGCSRSEKGVNENGRRGNSSECL